MFTNLSEAEEDARIKKVLKWKADIESEEKAAEAYEEKLEARKKKIEETNEGGTKDNHLLVRFFQFMLVKLCCSLFRRIFIRIQAPEYRGQVL